jgi:hypothetical protein
MGGLENWEIGEWGNWEIGTIEDREIESRDEPPF